MFLSDNQIANIYSVAISDLQPHLKHKITPYIVQELQQAFNLKLQNNIFGHLTQDEKNEAYKIFTLCVSATPGWAELPNIVQQQIIPVNLIQIQINNPKKHHHHHHHRHGLEPIDWMILGAALGDHHHHHHRWFCCSGSKRSKEDTDKTLFTIALFLITLIVLVLALLALYFLLTSILDCGERFCWREGRAQAVIQFTTTIAAGVGAGMLGSMLLVSPMASLGLVLGLSNPIGLLIAGSLLVGIAAAALTGLITKTIQNQVIAHFHTDAMDTHDPFRYALTPREAQYLEKNDFDCMAIKCAIVSLRAQLGKEGIPSYFFRPFTKDMDHRKHILKKIRQLRRGQLDEITIKAGGDTPELIFKLKIERIPPYNPKFYYNQSGESQFIHQYPPHVPHVYVQQNPNSFELFENRQPLSPFNPEYIQNRHFGQQPIYSDYNSVTPSSTWDPNR